MMGSSLIVLVNNCHLVLVVDLKAVTKSLVELRMLECVLILSHLLELSVGLLHKGRALSSGRSWTVAEGRLRTIDSHHLLIWVLESDRLLLKHVLLRGAYHLNLTNLFWLKFICKRKTDTVSCWLYTSRHILVFEPSRLILLDRLTHFWNLIHCVLRKVLSL